MPEWADRYPLEVRRRLAADDTFARLQYTSPRDAEPDRAADTRQPATTPEVPEPDAPDRAELDAAEPVREASADQLPQLSAKLREQLAKDPVFTREGWSRPDHEVRDADPEDQPQDLGDQPQDPEDQPQDLGDQPQDLGDEPRDLGDEPRDLGDAGSGSARSPVDLIEESPTGQKPTDDADAHTPRDDDIVDQSTDPIRPEDLRQERRTDHDNSTAHPSDDARAETPDDIHRAVDAEADSAGPHTRDETAEPSAVEPAADRSVDDADAPEHEFVEDADPKDMETYRRIRETDDVDAVAENTGFPREVVDAVKDHLFMREHDVAVRPGVLKHGAFTPLEIVGLLWDRGASGAELTDEERTQFWSLLAHEYVEAKLMQAGLPYNSADADAWNEYGMSKVTPEHPTAHNMAPRSLQERRVDLLAHWEKLDISRGGLLVADDLSNLDEVVRVAKEGLGL